MFCWILVPDFNKILKSIGLGQESEAVFRTYPRENDCHITELLYEKDPKGFGS